MDIVTEASIALAGVGFIGAVIAVLSDIFDRPLVRRLPAPAVVPLQELCPRCRNVMVRCWVRDRQPFCWCHSCGESHEIVDRVSVV